MKKLLLSSILVKRTLPINYLEKDSDIFSNEISRKLPSLYSYCYNNVCINTNQYLWKNFKFFGVTFFRQPKRKKEKLSNLKFLVKSFFRKKRKVKSGLWLIDNWSFNYFHWFGDVLQKYYALNHNNLRLILPSAYKKHEFIIFSAKYLNIELEFISEDEILKCKKLTIIPTSFISGNFYLEPIKILRSKLRKIEINSYSFKRIYITRKSASYRKVKNENELIRILDSYNFKVFDFDKVSFLELIKICFNVDVIISIHGAGLTNQIITKCGTKVLELRHEKSTQNTFFSLASALENKYYYLNSTPVNKTLSPQFADINIDIDRFQKVLEKIIK